VTPARFHYAAVQCGAKFSNPIPSCFEISGIGEATGSD
jgi:hypothetical protein